MKFENVVPWGRTLQEYREMFLLTNKDLESKILGCGDGPSSFNAELTKLGGDVTSIDPIYQFSKKDIEQRITETSTVISQQIRDNQNDFVWQNIKSVDELIDIRLTTMNNFIKDYNNGKKDGRYIHNELPKLDFEDNSFDLLLSSHFLFLYSEHFDLQFHIDSILEMCRVSSKEIRIFPLLDLKNQKSMHLEPILSILKENGYKTEITKSDYEFQKGANEMLKIYISL